MTRDAWGRVVPGNRPDALVGTFLGQPTVSELSDLLKAKDYEIGRIWQSYSAMKDAWWGRDQAAMSDWVSDWNGLNARYDKAKSIAKWTIWMTTVPSITPCPNEWQAILQAVKQDKTKISKGDLQDLYNRLQAAGAVVTFPRTPQPAKGSDVDLEVTNTLKPVSVLEMLPSASTMGGVLAAGAAAAGLVVLLVVLKK
jgi:hypothetical protein